MNLKKYAVRAEKSIKSWDEALPLGNGKLGCLIYGDGPLKMTVDRVDLWDTRPHPHTLEDGFCYKNLVKLSKSGKEEDWKERERLFEVISSQHAYPSKITAGRLELDFGINTENIQSYLDIFSAVAWIDIENGKAKAECFMSATQFVGVAKIWGEFALNLHIPTYISGKEDGTCALNSGIGAPDMDGSLHYPKATIEKDGDYLYYRQTTHTPFEYGVIVLRKDFDGYSELYFTIATNQDGADFIADSKRELAKISKCGYASLKSKHVAWWKEYWAKSQISVGDELLEKTYYRSWYLFASCSRKGFYPMPLQGVWTADNDSLPPWRGDYHHDTNTQLSYQACWKANRLSEGEAFIDYLWNMKDTFERFAKDFFCVEGLLLPSCSTLDGKPIGGWSHYALSPTMTIWAAQCFDEYYLYTGDLQFLRERAYPYFKGIGKAIYGLLEEKDGKLYLPLSSSPEIFDATPKAYLTPNSNFDLALLRYLYQTLIKYAEMLEEDATPYRDILSKLDEIAIGDGVVLLDKTQKLPVTHRHFSHVMCLYPLHLINYDTVEHKEIYEKTIFDLECLGTGLWVGFSFAMSAQIYAMAQKGNAAYERLRQFADGFVADNGFHLNGDFKRKGYCAIHYRPFTLESSFGFCDALQEMLLQEHQGYLHVFPAIPNEWKTRKISFKNLRSYNGVLVSAELKAGALTRITIVAQKQTKIRIKNTFNTVKVCVKNGDGYVTVQDDDEMITLTLSKGKTMIYEDGRI